MRRKVQYTTEPLQNGDEITQMCESEIAKIDTKKLRKIKELQTENRCHSAKSQLRVVKSKPTEICRTRSISPTQYSPPLSAKIPLKKFYSIYSKIIVQLETVKKISENKTNEVENIVDIRRQLKRADEFSIRFSRNNLYETKRIINDIKKLIVPYPFESLSTNECKLLCKKLIFGYQAASQSLQIYINYVKNPANIEVPEKIKELILLIADLFLCCEHLSLPADEVFIQNDAVKICNELITLLDSKSMGEYDEIIRANLTNKSVKQNSEDMQKMKKLSMYRTKLANPKLKMEVGRRKFGISYLLGNKTRKMKKKDERKARITHEIYTQKMNSRPGKGFGSKIVKFEPLKMKDEKSENVIDKLLLKRSRFFTPREVKSRDDDVETVVQTIGDDEGMTSRIGPTPRKVDENGDVSRNLNKLNFRELLLEAIEELQGADKKEQKETIKKLLDSIQNCSPRPAKVKVFHFKSKDLEEETQKEEKTNNGNSDSNPSVDITALHLEKKAQDEILSRERRLNIIFKTIREKKSEESVPLVVPKGKIKLKLSDEFMVNVNKYRKSFFEYRHNNIMYKKTMANKPWDLVGKVSDNIILQIIEEISQDLQDDAILQKLYLNELLEVTN